MFALVGPDWQGTLPDGVKALRFPNNSAIVALRIASYTKKPTLSRFNVYL